MRTSKPSNGNPQGGAFPRRKKVKLPPHSKLTSKIVRELDSFLEFAPPERLSRSLRTIFLGYLYHEKDSLEQDFNETVTDLQFLFEFLDSSAAELGRPKQPG